MQTIQNRPVAGVMWMLVTGGLFVAVTAVVRHVGSSLPAPEAAFLRYAIGLVLVIPMLRPLFRARVTPRQWKLFGLRGATHTVAVALWFFAMARLPVAEVTAMNYLSPVFVTILAALFLGERLAVRRIMAIVVAMLGVLVILRPGLRELSTGHIAMLIAASLFSISYLTAKILSDEFPAEAVVGMLSVTVAIGLAPLALAVWQTPTWGELGWMALVAGFATAGHYTMTRAFKAAPLAVTQPVSFLQLVWAALLGAVVFGEQLDLWVMVGGALILGSVSFITWREWVLKRRSVTPAPMATKG